MPKRISRAIGTTHAALAKHNAFDGFVDVDSRVYVDPHLLEGCQEPEFRQCRQSFEAHFRNVLKLLKASKTEGDLPWREALKRMHFPEVSETALGYTADGTRGRGIRGELSLRLTRLAKEIIALGIEDPDMFTLLGLLQEGVGADLISDMTVWIALEAVLAYSARVAADVGASTVDFTHGDRTYRVPAVQRTGRPVLLVPSSLLRRIPVAFSWFDVDLVAGHNSVLRERVNHRIGNTWKHATRDVDKATLRKTLLKHPALLADLIDQYKAKARTAYDFRSDPDAVQVWYELADALVREVPVDLTRFRTMTGEQLLEFVKELCAAFRRLVEANRLGRLVYNDNGRPRSEKIVQLTFYAVAALYCEQNNIDLTPEANAGAGPVDFKLSQGAAAKVTVELKLSSNPRLVHGFTEQLPAYGRAENTQHRLLLLVRTTDEDKHTTALDAARREAVARGDRVPEIVRVDARPEPSASKRRRK